MQPEERRLRLATYGHAHSVLVEALARFPREMWQYRPAPDRWTIHEVVVHIADSEANSYIRCRRCLAEPGSPVAGYDETRWARELHYHEQSPEESLELFKWLRRKSHTLIQDLPEAAWSNTMVHSESGMMTLDEWLDIYDRHIPEHIAQMQATYADWLKSRAD